MSRIEFVELTPPERATYYRELAHEMLHHATTAGSEETRKEYLKMAVGWLDMAEMLEAEYAKVSVTVLAPELTSLLRQHQG
jgi:hypothetical protein